MKLKAYIFRFIYLLSLFGLVYFTFIDDNHLFAVSFGTIFFFSGFYLFYLEKLMEKHNPDYSNKISSTIWRLLLFPWFIIM
jgi:hypothetical protein